MILLQPEQSGGEEEGADLIFPIVKDHGAPLFMLPFPGVGVLVAGLAVKLIKTKAVLGEVGGHPVQDHPNAGLMQLVHQIHEVVGGAETAGGGKVAGTLIAPGHIQRVLGDGHQLHMGEAHLFHIGHQILRHVPVGEKFIRSGTPPGTQMDLVNIEGGGVDRVGLPPFQPFFIAPAVAAQVVDLGGVPRPGLGVEGKGVGLGQHPAVGGVDGVLICGIAIQPGHEALPDAGADGSHGAGLLRPAVEVPHDVDRPGMGSPDPENIALPAVPGRRVAAQKVMETGGVACGKGIQRRRGGGDFFGWHEMTSMEIGKK